MNIPNYPNFAPLSLEHKDSFDAAFRKFPPEISEFTFTNIYSWRISYGFEVSFIEGAILLRSKIAGKLSFFPLIGACDTLKIVKLVLRDSDAEFIRVPEEIKKVLEIDEEFLIKQDRDNADYLYLYEDLVNLSGRKYDGKRNQMKKFKQTYEYGYEDIKCSRVHEILDFEEGWCEVRDCDHVEGLNNERKSIVELSNNSCDFRVFMGKIATKNKIAAVAVGEMLNPETLVMHILKADPLMPGSYQVMLNDFLKARSRGITYVNLEQDLGVDGLRNSKLSYQPLRLVNKYSICLKGKNHV